MPSLISYLLTYILCTRESSSLVVVSTMSSQARSMTFSDRLLVPQQVVPQSLTTLILERWTFNAVGASRCCLSHVALEYFGLIQRTCSYPYQIMLLSHQLAEARSNYSSKQI